MQKKICIVSPAGANGNYIALVLSGLLKKNELSYHNQGTHSDQNKTIKQIHIYNNEQHNNIINDDSYFVLQNVVNDKFWFVIINWWEKMMYNSSPYTDLDDFVTPWIREQKERWNMYKHPIVRAILNWFYAYKNKERPECLRINEIKNTFNFESLYTDYENTASQFAQFGIQYTQKDYQLWKDSQRVIFESNDQINNMPIKFLKKDYQKAIAIGLLGINNNLSENECWDQLSVKLQ